MPRSNTVIQLVHSAFSPDHSLLLNCYTAAAPLTLPLSTVRHTSRPFGHQRRYDETSHSPRRSLAALSDIAVRPSVCPSPRRTAARDLSCTLAACSLAMCGLRTRPRTNVDPPRVELPSAGHIVSPPPRGDTLYPLTLTGRNSKSIQAKLTDDERQWRQREFKVGRL